MLKVLIKHGLLGTGEREEVAVDWRPGLTAAQLRAGLGTMLPSSSVGVAVDGVLLDDDAEIPDGATVLVAAAPGAVIVPFVVQALIAAVVAVGIGYLMQALTPRPQAPGVPQERGDESSPTYAWDGVQTSYGQGFTIPVVYGRHAVGGQVIYSDVFTSTASGSLFELLRVVLFLSEGPIYRIGDQLARVADGLGGYAGGGAAGGAIPDHIRANENLLDSTAPLPGARVYLRPGTFDQPPLPTNPFRGATATFTVGDRLDEANQEAVFSYVGTDAISTIGFAFTFPGGLYQQDPQGNQSAYPVTLNLSWRPTGTTAWRSLYVPGGTTTRNTWTFGTQPVLGPGTETFGGDLNPNGLPQRGPLEVRVVRVTASGAGGQVVSSLAWRSVAVNINQEFAYPGGALLGLEMLATGRISGQLPSFNVRVDGALVRVWDATHGFSPRCWDPPAAPFNFSSVPPGRNPAWILADFLTARWGLGAYIDDDRIDWPAFRRWSAFCATIPDGWSEPGFLCDLVLDSPRPAWEIVLAICAAGRAAPVWRNGKISVVYQYRDAHGDSGIIVPARSAVQLITSGLCDNVQVRWLPKGERSTVYDFQFLNGDQLYAQDVLPVEDEEATGLNDPTDPNGESWRPEVVQAYGVTRATQLRREGFYMHRVNRLVRRELTFTCGPWLLAAEVGDLIDFEHDLLRPFGGDVPLAMQVVAGGDNVTTITVDHEVSGSIAFAARDRDGKPVHRTVTGTTPTAVAGRACTVLSFASPVTIDAGAAVAVGLVDKLVERYQVVGITLGKDLRRNVRALQWVPELFDAVPAGGGTDAPEVDTVLEQPGVAGDAPEAVDLYVRALQNGMHRIGWSRPAGRGSARARVFARSDAAAVWYLVDETVRASTDVPWFEPWRPYQLAVCLENERGEFPPPDLGAQLEFTPEEFPSWAPAAPTNLVATQSAGQDLLLLRWDQVDGADLAHYEVRAGSHWAAGQVVYRGQQAEARLRPPAAVGAFMVAARSKSGLYGPRAAVAVTIEAVPTPGAVLVDTDEHAPTAGSGTHDGTELDATTEPAAPFLALASGQLAGTYTADAVDLGYQAPFFLRVALDVQELDGATVDDLTFAVDSGEARWRTVDARPASPALPGIDWSTAVDDLAMTIDDVPRDLRVAGTIGEVGSHVLCRVESRTYTGGSWSAWAEHVDRAVVCSQWQARVVLARSSIDRAVRARTLRLETLL